MVYRVFRVRCVLRVSEEFHEEKETTKSKTEKQIAISWQGKSTMVLIQVPGTGSWVLVLEKFEKEN